MPPEHDSTVLSSYRTAITLLRRSYLAREEIPAVKWVTYFEKTRGQTKPAGVDGLVVAAAHIEACLALGLTDQGRQLADKMKEAARSVSPLTAVDRAGELRLIWFAMGRAYYMAMMLDSAMECFERVCESSDWARREARGMLALINWHSGSVKLAEQIIDAETALLRLEEDVTLKSQALGLARCGAAIARVKPDELEQALRAVEQPLDYPWKQIHAMFEAAHAAFTGDHVRALSLLHEVEHELSAFPHADLLMAEQRYLLVVTRLLQGRPGMAAVNAVQPTSDATHRRCFPSLRAAALVTLGMHTEAHAAIEPCLAMGDEHDSHSASDLMVVTAAVNVSLQRRDVAETSSLDAVAATERVGGIIPAVLPGSVLAALPLIESVGPNSITTAPDSIHESATQLSKRERDILASMGSYERLDDHATALYLSRNTLKAHYRSIYAKLGVTTRADAIDFAERAGFRLLDLAA